METRGGAREGTAHLGEMRCREMPPPLAMPKLINDDRCIMCTCLNDDE
jgi:hypothetical protein